MSVFSNPLLYESLFYTAEDNNPSIVLEKALNPEITIKNGSQTTNAQTITYNQYRYIIAYGQLSIFLYFFQNVNYTGGATGGSPVDLLIPLPEFPPASPGDIESSSNAATAIFFDTSQGSNPPETASANISQLQMYGPGFKPTVSVPTGDGYGIVVTVTGDLSNTVFGLLLFYLNVPLLQLPRKILFL
jgi:hypothetical protein